MFQLPLTFFTPQQRWIASPGFVDGQANFARPITARCLECHATYAHALPGALNRYQPASVMWGVTCERCHGSATEHVRAHRQEPQAAHPMAIVNPAELPRERQLDLCNTCHGGVGRSLAPPFSYNPGEPLADYLALEHQRSNNAARPATCRCGKTGACPWRPGGMSPSRRWWTTTSARSRTPWDRPAAPAAGPGLPPGPTPAAPRCAGAGCRPVWS